jgi:hypothetical protein
MFTPLMNEAKLKVFFVGIHNNNNNNTSSSNSRKVKDLHMDSLCCYRKKSKIRLQNYKNVHLSRAILKN